MNSIPIRQLNPEKDDVSFWQTFKIQKLSGKAVTELPHRHNYYFLLAIISGAGKHKIDFEDYTVKEYDIFVLRPGQVHQLQLEKGTNGYLLNIMVSNHFNRDSFKLETLKKVARCNYLQLSSTQFKSCLEYLEAIDNEFDQRKPGYEDIIKANLTILLTQLLRSEHNNKTASFTYTQQRFEEFQELLETHIYTIKTVSTYASLMKLSTYQLNAITKSHTKKTCSELIQEQVILEAKRLLLSTTNQIGEIAFQLGYEDISYFNRLFKKLTNMTPSYFRNRYK